MHTIQSISSGAYQWSCCADDNDTANSGVVCANNRTFTVSTPGNNPPTVYLDSPIDGYDDPDGTIDFLCHATDSDGTITDVKLLIDSIEQSCPAHVGGVLNCQVSGITEGDHSWNCRATDDDGATALGTQRQFTVTFPMMNPPRVSLHAPANGASYEGFTAIQFVCNTTDNQRIDKIEVFYQKDSGPFESKSVYYPFKKNILAPNADFELVPWTGIVSWRTNETFWPFCTSSSGTASCVHETEPDVNVRVIP
jgi:hypothetical protein